MKVTSRMGSKPGVHPLSSSRHLENLAGYSTYSCRKDSAGSPATCLSTQTTWRHSGRCASRRRPTLQFTHARVARVGDVDDRLAHVGGVGVDASRSAQGAHAVEDVEGRQLRCRRVDLLMPAILAVDHDDLRSLEDPFCRLLERLLVVHAHQPVIVHLAAELDLVPVPRVRAAPAGCGVTPKALWP